MMTTPASAADPTPLTETQVGLTPSALVLLSAKTRPGLDAAVQALSAHLEQPSRSEAGARLLGAPAAQVGAMRFDLRQWRQFYPKVAGSPLFAELDRSGRASNEASKKAGDLLAALRAAEPSVRRQRLESLVREQITEVLRLDPSRINASTPLSTLGFDSLMAVELRNRLEVRFGTTLPVTLVWGYPTIVALVPHLATKIGVALESSGATAPEVNKKDDSALNTLLGAIEQLSTDSALSMLVGKRRKDK